MIETILHEGGARQHEAHKLDAERARGHVGGINTTCNAQGQPFFRITRPADLAPKAGAVDHKKLDEF